MAVVTVSQLDAGGASAGVGYLLRAPQVYSEPGAASRELQAMLQTVAQASGRRLKRQAQQAYVRYPRIAAGFQQVTTARNGVVAAGITATGPMIARDGGTPVNLFALREYDTAPHRITAHNALYGWLVFPTSNGGWARKKTVQHPGTHGMYAIDALFAAEAAAFEAALVRGTLEVLDGL